MPQRYAYLRDPAAIYRQSFAMIEQEAGLARLSDDLRSLAMRLAHAAGDTTILADLGWSSRSVVAGRSATTMRGKYESQSIAFDAAPAAREFCDGQRTRTAAN